MNNSVVVLVGDDELGGVEEHDDGAGEPTTSLHRVPWRRWRCWPADPHKVAPDEQTCLSMQSNVVKCPRLSLHDILIIRTRTKERH